ncbi:MAG: histidine kinase [Flavobacteriales bacterium]|nr:histidine kinase [Flavobacteriales bacterium]
MRTAWLMPLLLSATLLQGQQYGFTRYAPKDGLAQSQVRCIAQETNGHMWFGTIGGASRFDGQVWENYGTREGLQDLQVTALLEEPNEGIWIAAGTHLHRWWNGRSQMHDLPAEWPDARITALAHDAKGRLLIASEGAGVWRLDNGHCAMLDDYPRDTAGHVRELFLAQDHTLYIGLRNGLLAYSNGSYRHVTLDKEEPPSVSAIAQDGQGTLWVGTFGDGIYALENSGRVRRFTMANGLLQDHIRDLIVDRRGQVWACTKFGLNRIQDGRVRSYNIHQGMPNDNAWCMWEDVQGHLWVGTDGGGVLRFAGDAFVTLTTREGLCSDLVMSVVSDSEGDLWLGTYGSGVCRQDAMAMLTTSDGLPNNTIWCGLRDSRGQLWFGTSDGPCRLVDGKVLALVDPGAVMGQRILSMYEDPETGIWLGAREGLYLLDHDGRLRASYSTQEGAGRSIRSIRASRNGTLWLATADGLRSFHRGSFSRILEDTEVNCLSWDQADRLWAGTNNGLYCLVDGGLLHFDLASDPGAQIISLLSTDGEGRVWAGTNNGLFRLDPEALVTAKGQAVRFTDTDGLLSTEFNLNATFLDAHGRIFFGSSGGLLIHHPERIRHALQAPPPEVHITGLRSFLRPTDWADRCDSLSIRTGLPMGLALPHRRNHITFDFKCVELVHPERVLYRYRLVGSDEEWLPSTNARYASYGSLPHGDYTFEAIASLDGRTWSAPAQIHFRVLPPFWLTWWFFAASAMVLTVLAYGLYRVRRAQRERRERTRHLMLRSRMLRLEQQALNAHMNRHFVFNALNSIQYYINRQDRISANRYLTSFARLIRRNLDASQSDTTSLAEELERLHLYLELEHMRFKDKFHYEVKVEPGTPVDQVRIPAMMLQPYVENSIWHGILPMDRSGSVRIAVARASGSVIRITVTDDGIGLSASRNARSSADGDHISRGIEITKGRADVMRTLDLARIDIRGPEEILDPNGAVKGTQVTIEIALNGTSRKDPEKLRTAQEQPIFGTS